MKNTFRNLLIISICWAGMAATPAEAQTKLIASMQWPMDSTFGRAYTLLDRCLQDKTKGDISLQIYPSAQLGGQPEAVEHVRQGVVDITVVTPSAVTNFVPELQIFTMPFAFRDVQHWKDVVTGPIGKKLSDLLLQKANVRIVGYFGGSARLLVTRKPVNGVADVRGAAMRFQPSPMLTAWSSIGIAPSNVAYAELYNALRSGSVDGFESEPEWVLRMKFYEQAPNIALTSHEIVTRLVLLSSQRLARLPKEKQDILMQCINDAAEFERNLEIKLDQDTLNMMAQKHNVKMTKVNKDEFQKLASNAAVPLVQKYGLATLVKEIEAARK